MLTVIASFALSKMVHGKYEVQDQRGGPASKKDLEAQLRNPFPKHEINLEEEYEVRETKSIQDKQVF